MEFVVQFITLKQRNLYNCTVGELSQNREFGEKVVVQKEELWKHMCICLMCASSAHCQKKPEPFLWPCDRNAKVLLKSATALATNTVIASPLPRMTKTSL